MHLETVGPRAGQWAHTLAEFRDYDPDAEELAAARRELKASGDPYPCVRRHGERKAGLFRRMLGRFLRA